MLSFSTLKPKNELLSPTASYTDYSYQRPLRSQHYLHQLQHLQVYYNYNIIDLAQHYSMRYTHNKQSQPTKNYNCKVQ